MIRFPCHRPNNAAKDIRSWLIDIPLSGRGRNIINSWWGLCVRPVLVTITVIPVKRRIATRMSGEDCLLVITVVLLKKLGRVHPIIYSVFKWAEVVGDNYYYFYRGEILSHVVCASEDNHPRAGWAFA